MSQLQSLFKVGKEKARQQALALMMMGVLSFIVAWIFSPDPLQYPVGVAVLGLGLALSTVIYPYRLLIAAWMITPLGVAVYLIFRHLIPGSETLAAFILAIGISMLGIAFATIRDLVGRGAVSPAILVLTVGLVEAFLPLNIFPAGFIGFMLSLWMPGLGLLVLGLVYFFTSR